MLCIVTISLTVRTMSPSLDLALLYGGSISGFNKIIEGMLDTFKLVLKGQI